MLAGFIAPYLLLFYCGSLLVFLALLVGVSSVFGWWEQAEVLSLQYLKLWWKWMLCCRSLFSCAFVYLSSMWGSLAIGVTSVVHYRVSAVLQWSEQRHFPCNTSSLMLWPWISLLDHTRISCSRRRLFSCAVVGAAGALPLHYLKSSALACCRPLHEELLQLESLQLCSGGSSSTFPQ